MVVSSEEDAFPSSPPRPRGRAHFRDGSPLEVRFETGTGRSGKAGTGVKAVNGKNNSASWAQDPRHYEIGLPPAGRRKRDRCAGSHVPARAARWTVLLERVAEALIRSCGTTGMDGTTRKPLAARKRSAFYPLALLAASRVASLVYLSSPCDGFRRKTPPTHAARKRAGGPPRPRGPPSVRAKRSRSAPSLADSAVRPWLSE